MPFRALKGIPRGQDENNGAGGEGAEGHSQAMCTTVDALQPVSSLVLLSERPLFSIVSCRKAGSNHHPQTQLVLLQLHSGLQLHVKFLLALAKHYGTSPWNYSPIMYS